MYIHLILRRGGLRLLFWYDAGAPAKAKKSIWKADGGQNQSKWPDGRFSFRAWHLDTHPAFSYLGMHAYDQECTGSSWYNRETTAGEL